MTDYVEQIKAKLTEINDFSQGRMKDFDKELKGLKDQMIDLAQKGGIPSAYGEPASKDAGSMISKSADLDRLRQRTVKSVIIPSTDSIQMLTKAVVGDAGGVGDNSFDLQPQRRPGIGNDPRRALRLLDIAPKIQVSTNKYEFMSLDGFVNAADYQLTEGAAKAEQDFPTGISEANIATIAITLPASEQVLADAPGLQQFLNGKLIYGVLDKLEREVVNGIAGTGKITGLVSQATAFTQTAGAPTPDALGEAMAQLEVTGWTAGVIVLHPLDWQAIRSERNASDEYVSTGWNSPAAPNIWGVPVVTTAAIAQGTALVMDVAQMAVLDRMSPRFDIGYTNNQFAENMLTMRCELRAGLAVFAPSAVLKLTL